MIKDDLQNFVYFEFKLSHLAEDSELIKWFKPLNLIYFFRKNVFCKLGKHFTKLLTTDLLRQTCKEYVWEDTLKCIVCKKTFTNEYHEKI